MRRRVAVTFILGLDCLVDADDVPPRPEAEEGPAAIYALEAPREARAGERFSINAWVYLGDEEPTEVLAPSFTAEVDEAARTITVTGRVRRVVGGPERPGPRVERALVVGIAGVAPAPGEYVVRVPAAYVPAGQLPDDLAQGATWPLTITQ